MPTITVIITYFNEPIEFIKGCISSILNQSFKDYEIIVVNDGSTLDKSQELRNECNKINNLMLIEQSNQGVSAARNTAMKNAQGKYIVFVDADDYISNSFFSEAIEIAERWRADIVYSYAMQTENELSAFPSSTSYPVHKVDDKWLIEHTVGTLYRDGSVIFGRGPWARFVRAELANTVAFPERVPIGEDVIWNLGIIRNAHTKVLAETVWYKYMVRPTSVTKKFDSRIGEKLIPFYNQIKNSVDENTIDSYQYYKRVARDLKRYLFWSNYGNEDNNDSFINRWRCFNNELRKEPWNYLTNHKQFSLSNREKMRELAIRLRIIFPIWYIISKVRH